MIGPELAAVLEPFAKWGIVVAGALFLVWLVRFWIRQGAKATEELVTMQEDQEERSDARTDYRQRARKLLGRWDARRRRKRLLHARHGSDPAA